MLKSYCALPVTNLHDRCLAFVFLLSGVCLCILVTRIIMFMIDLSVFDFRFSFLKKNIVVTNFTNEILVNPT